MKNKIKIAIADDQELIRQSLSVILNSQPDMEIVLIAENGKQLIENYGDKKPDIALVDVRMPIIDGVECTRVLKEKFPHTKIIILTTFEDDEYIFNALKFGASGYLLKAVKTDELIASIRVAYEGGGLINPNVAVKVFKYFSQMARGELKMHLNGNLNNILNKKEINILKLIGLGFSNKEISKKLCLTEGTCRNYISDILEKTGLRDKTQLAILAIQSGLTYMLKNDEDNEQK